jgi:hypothetical protein
MRSGERMQPTAGWWNVTIADIQEEKEARRKEKEERRELLAHRRNCLQILMQTAVSAIPDRAMVEFREAVDHYFAYFGQIWRPPCLTEDEQLMVGGFMAYALAAAFAKVVSIHYAAIVGDRSAANRSAAKKRVKRASADARRVRSSLALYPLQHPSVEKIAEAAKLLDEVAQEQRRPRGNPGFKEFRCWVTLLAVAYEDGSYLSRRPTVTHAERADRGAENFGQFVEFVEGFVKRAEDAFAPSAVWWPATKTARAALIDDVIRQKNADRRWSSWWVFLRFEQV